MTPLDIVFGLIAAGSSAAMALTAWRTIQERRHAVLLRRLGVR
jgi:hypothetical protein